MDERDGVVGLVLAGVLAWILPFAAGALAPRGPVGAAIYATPDGRGPAGEDLAWTSSPTARDGWVLGDDGVPLHPIGGWRGLLLGNPLDLNTATAADLEALPGIGPRNAAAVLAHREAVGEFAAVEDLARVHGIGPATVRRLGPRLLVGRSQGSR